MNITIHKYNDDCELVYYNMNEHLIDYLSNLGIEIEDKIGEGITADVFRVRWNNRLAALVIPSNSINHSNITSRIELINRFPHIFATVYDHFRVDIPYSNDVEYLRTSKNFSDRTIQLMELMDTTSDKYISYDNKDEIVSVLTSHLMELADNGIVYCDLKLDNIGVKYSGDCGYIIKLIDIESIRISSEKNYNPLDIEQLVEYRIMPLLAEGGS